ncbi:hypothetical protein MBLNU459_g5968t1 [Dothideomycetes sp. NU459]
MEWEHQAREVRSGKKKSMLAVLEERGLIKDIAGDRSALDSLLTSRRVGAYAGIDPTAPSLHLGHLLPFMILFWLYIHGYSTTSLIGGATARIGDPTGRLTSRTEPKAQTRMSNLVSMHNQVRGLWMNVDKIAKKHGYVKTLAWKRAVLNNSTWMNKLSIVDFLSFMGKGARLGTMLGRDTVKNKMANGDGMSFAEFSYPLLQAWDWWHMYSTQNVQLQIGGSDQYGNIVAGMDAIKHLLSTIDSEEMQKASVDSLSQPFGVTVPLLTTSSGIKFGKSAGNAVWMDKNMTSSFDLYGFLLRTSDSDVERYLRLFTFLPLEHIATVMAEHLADPSKRIAQHLLARQVLELVHGAQEADDTAQAHQLLRKPTFSSLSTPQQDSESDGVELNKRAVSRMRLPHSLVYNTPPARILFHAGIAKTKSDGARMIKAGGVYIGAESAPADTKGMPQGELTFRPLTTTSQETIDSSVVQNGVVVLRSGKWKVRVVEVLTDADFDTKGLTAPGWAEWKLAKDEQALKDIFEKSKTADEEQARIAKEKRGSWENEDDMWKKLRSP